VLGVVVGENIANRFIDNQDEGGDWLAGEVTAGVFTREIANDAESVCLSSPSTVTKAPPAGVTVQYTGRKIQSSQE